MRLTPAQLLAGYARGVFPMADNADDPALYWYDPPHRGVLPIGGMHVSRSLLRDLRRGDWTAHLNLDFDATVQACAKRETTWINQPLADLYHQLHLAGYAHSLEVRYQSRFAGAVFGVSLGGAFFGESMVSGRTNGSKIALLWLTAHLKRCEYVLFDTQFLTPHLHSLGGREISRQEYQKQLDTALTLQRSTLSQPLLSKDQLVQEITHTS